MTTFTKLSIATAAFIVLFYNQEPGLNTSIFALLVWAISWQSRTRRANPQVTAWLSAACFISALSFAWYGDLLSFFALFISTVIAGVYFRFPRLRLAAYPVIAAMNVISFPFRIFLMKSWLPARPGKANWQRWLALAVVPAIFLTLFSFVYATGSDAFSRLFNNIFIDVDILQVIFLGVMGFVLVFNLWALWIPRIIFRLNTELSDDFGPSFPNRVIPGVSLFSKDLELKSGEVSFFLLNLLLLVFVATYNYEQFFNAGGLHALSDETHQRVATVIVAILLAIGLILFYFKSKITAAREAKRLRQLAGVWIMMNALLVLSAFVKNGEYILQYGLTFKRISVIIFLLLCLIGLMFTAFKIVKQRTNFYLIHRMTVVLVAALVVLAPVNFSWIVTKYNIGHQKQPDESYLRSLPYNKHLLMHHFKSTKDWEEYITSTREDIREENSRPLLSSHLYYRQFGR